ncbi:MAG: hypothetical protein LC713_03670, partial [Actinobacteria bacterium]|nr:hypothetical protein [Actinomycetota bacterium]
ARLERADDVWLLVFDGRSLHLQDAKGLRQLAALLSSPGTPIPATALARPRGGGRGAAAPPRNAQGDLSEQRARAGELREEIAEARAFNDPERRARATAELELLAAELADGGHAVSGERARINVTRAIRAALRRIAAHEPELGHMLQRTVRTGSSCVYRPDPDAPLHWHVSA